jgi:hypothetical protein
MSTHGYDIVGDIHGHADALHRLLDALGYAEVEGVFRHSERKMLFVGDFVDRGPEQREVLQIARSMCEAGSAAAVLGNHEFNAIGWATQQDDGGFLRDHSSKNAHQHGEFLRQLEADSSDHQDAIRWFRSLPVWLDLSGIRVVHACWHEPSIAALLPFLDERGRFTEAGLRESYRHGSDAHAAVEILLKGPEQRLPRAFIFLTRMGTSGGRFGCVGGTETQQRFERLPSGWMGGKTSYRTQSFRGTSDTTKAPPCSSAIIG